MWRLAGTATASSTPRVRYSVPGQGEEALMQLSGPDDQAAKVLEASHQYETLLAAKGYKLLG